MYVHPTIQRNCVKTSLLSYFQYASKGNWMTPALINQSEACPNRPSRRIKISRPRVTLRARNVSIKYSNLPVDKQVFSFIASRHHLIDTTAFLSCHRKARLVITHTYVSYYIPWANANANLFYGLRSR